MKRTLFWHFLWTAPFICFIAGYILISHVFTTEHINPPNVVGKSLQQALSIISDHNLNARLLTHKDDALLPEGTVLSQTPNEAQKIKTNQTVFLVVSKKPTQKSAPYLVGKTTQEITNVLSASSIKPLFYELASNYPAHTCFAQFPNAGQPIEHDSITVYLAHNVYKPVITPNLKGKNISDVIEFLSTFPVEPEIIHASWQTDNHTCNECKITDQRPLPGTIIELHNTKQMPIQLMVDSSP